MKPFEALKNIDFVPRRDLSALYVDRPDIASIKADDELKKKRSAALEKVIDQEIINSAKEANE
jgi:hypothetical protein